MRWADVCVLVLPCGRSAHTEASWMAGAGKKVIAYIPDKEDPELIKVPCTWKKSTKGDRPQLYHFY